MERPFYVSDGVLKVALIGLNHKNITPSVLPVAVAPASAALNAPDLDSADVAWSLVSLVFAYESAYVDCPVNSISVSDMALYRQALAQQEQEAAAAPAANAAQSTTVSSDVSASAAASTDADAGAGAASTAAQLVARVQLLHGPLPVSSCPPEPENQRYLSPQLISALDAYSSNAVVWLDILARLQGMGLKVPAEYLLTFLQTYRRLKSVLNQLYQALPLEFLSARGRYLLPYVSASMAKSRSDDEEGDDDDDTARFSAEVGTTEWFSQVRDQWRHGSALERKGAVAALLRHDNLGFLLDLIEADFKTLAAPERANLVGLISAHWLTQRHYWYEDSSQGQVTAADPTASAVAVPASTAVDADTTVHAESTPLQRVTSWLLGLIQTDRSKDVKAKATALLRCVPYSPLEEQIVALVRQVFTVKEKNGKRSYSLADVTTDEIVQAMSTLLPEIDIRYLQKDARLAFTELCWYVSPALWFELLALERSGDTAQDAELLFTTFVKAFPGMEAITAKYPHSLRDTAVLYFINRIGPELGDVYRAAFYQHCAESLPYDVVIAIITQASYAERETLPLVLAPQRFPLVFMQQARSLYELLSFAFKLCTEPAQSWGPNFSQFYLDLLLRNYDREQWAHMYFYSGVATRNNLDTIAWVLAPQVRAQAVTRIKELRSKVQADIATREQEAQQLQDAKAREDKAKLQRLEREIDERQNGIKVLDQFLESIAQAERVQLLCAQTQ